MVGKYIPTQDSKAKRLSMRILMSAPGVDKMEDRLPASAVNGDKIVERTGSDVKAERMRGVDVEMESVAHPMARVASPSMPAAKFSVEMALLFPFLSTLVEEVIWPNIVDPRRQHATVVGLERKRERERGRQDKGRFGYGQLRER